MPTNLKDIELKNANLEASGIGGRTISGSNKMKKVRILALATKELRIKW